MYFQETPPYGQYTYDVLVGKFITLSNQFRDLFVLSEWHIYGSSRLGIQKPVSKDSHAVPNFVGIASAGTGRELVHIEFNGSWSSYEVNYADTSNTTITTYQMSYEYYSLTRGEKNYELVNHLGNVLVVISDKKLKTCTGDTVNYFTADVVQATDYSAFGVMLKGREYYADTAGKYGMGFDGKLIDNETYGDGNEYDYGFRIYSPRLGKFLSVDPLAPKFPFYSPYHFAGNKPTIAVDLDGLEDFVVIRWYDPNNPSQWIKTTVIKIVNANDKKFGSGKILYLQLTLTPENQEIFVEMGKASSLNAPTNRTPFTNALAVFGLLDGDGNINPAVGWLTNSTTAENEFDQTLINAVDQTLASGKGWSNSRSKPTDSFVGFNFGESGFDPSLDIDRNNKTNVQEVKKCD